MKLCSVDWIKKKKKPSTKTLLKPVRVVDLFCGCGGLTLGAWEACRVNKRKINIELSVDFSKEAINIYRKNFEVNGDVAKLEDIVSLFPGNIGKPFQPIEKKIKEKLKKTNLLLAGPPCQGHSDLNNKTRRDDPRNNLYLKVIRATEILFPNIVIIENVPSIIHDKNSVIEKATNTLKKLDYEVLEKILDTSEFSLAQKRKRHILIASRDGKIEGLKSFLNKKEKKIPLSVFLTGLEDEPRKNDGIFYTPSKMGEENKKRAKFLYNKNLYDMPNHLRPPCHQNGNHSYVSMYGRLWWDKPAQTITGGFGSMGQGRFLHPLRLRTLTPHEVARIQGFPDFFDFSLVQKRTSLHQMLGNAVPPNFSAEIVHYFIQEGII
jgi:DNA (cytosine-5)-methyltransferase 1